MAAHLTANRGNDLVDDRQDREAGPELRRQVAAGLTGPDNRDTRQLARGAQPRVAEATNDDRVRSLRLENRSRREQPGHGQVFLCCRLDRRGSIGTLAHGNQGTGGSVPLQIGFAPVQFAKPERALRHWAGNEVGDVHFGLLTLACPGERRAGAHLGRGISTLS